MTSQAQSLSEEENRHRCAVRQLLAWRVDRGVAWADAWLDAHAMGMQKTRAEKMRTDFLDQWKLGNRGARGDWR